MARWDFWQFFQAGHNTASLGIKVRFVVANLFDDLSGNFRKIDDRIRLKPRRDKNNIGRDGAFGDRSRIGIVTQKAIEEINRLAGDSPYRNNVLELLSDLKVVLEAKKSRNREDRELLMSLRTSPLYLEQIDLVKREGKREIIFKQLNRKLGVLPVELVAKIDDLSSERLDSLSETLLDFQKMEDLIVWLDENR
jgi:hypothetical protein